MSFTFNRPATFILAGLMILGLLAPAGLATASQPPVKNARDQSNPHATDPRQTMQLVSITREWENVLDPFQEKTRVLVTTQVFQHESLTACQHIAEVFGPNKRFYPPNYFVWGRGTLRVTSGCEYGRLLAVDLMRRHQDPFGWTVVDENQVYVNPGTKRGRNVLDYCNNFRRHLWRVDVLQGPLNDHYRRCT